MKWFFFRALKIVTAARIESYQQSLCVVIDSPLNCGFLVFWYRSKLYSMYFVVLILILFWGCRMVLWPIPGNLCQRWFPIRLFCSFVALNVPETQMGIIVLKSFYKACRQLFTLLWLEAVIKHKKYFQIATISVWKTTSTPFSILDSSAYTIFLTFSSLHKVVRLQTVSSYHGLTITVQISIYDHLWRVTVSSNILSNILSNFLCKYFIRCVIHRTYNHMKGDSTPSSANGNKYCGLNCQNLSSNGNLSSPHTSHQ